MKIVLNGYRASGKSTVAKILAEKLGLVCLDVDRGIEAHCQKTIAEIFQEDGEPYYREVEKQVAAEMCAKDNAVVSFGGGTMMTPATEAMVKGDAFVVYLKAPVDVLWGRSCADAQTATTRPNLAGGGREEIVEMLAKREPVYERSADLILDATQSPETLVQAITEQLIHD